MQLLLIGGVMQQSNNFFAFENQRGSPLGNAVNLSLYIRAVEDFKIFCLSLNVIAFFILENFHLDLFSNDFDRFQCRVHFIWRKIWQSIMEFKYG